MFRLNHGDNGSPQPRGQWFAPTPRDSLRRDGTHVAAMEHGLGTVIGPRGLRLSGGQTQRVAALMDYL
jgi:hypothetical protein